jgi:hypothetical protein
MNFTTTRMNKARGYIDRNITKIQTQSWEESQERVPEK